MPFSKDRVMPHNLEDDPGSCSPSLTSIDKRVKGEGQRRRPTLRWGRCRVFDHSHLLETKKRGGLILKGSPQGSVPFLPPPKKGPKKKQKKRTQKKQKKRTQKKRTKKKERGVSVFHTVLPYSHEKALMDQLPRNI